MDCNSKIRLLSSEKLKIRSSVEAFIASKISADWTNCKEILEAVSGTVSKEYFEKIIEQFVETGAVEKEGGQANKIVFNNGFDVRDYTGIVFDQKELEEAPGLPLNLKKELLFLYYYGNSIDYYRILNISKEASSNNFSISEKCNRSRMMVAGKNYEGVELGSYKSKIEKVRAIIRKACQIEELDSRKEYDNELKRSASVGTSSNQKNTGLNVNYAEKHFLLAVKHYHGKDIKRALEDILVAIHIDPKNEEYVDLKNELTEKLKNEQTTILFNAFENNDSLLLDEEKLEKVISGIVELTESSPLTHLKLAEIALEKDMPEMAIDHAHKAIQKDPDLKNKVEEIIRKANLQMKNLYLIPEDQKTFQINKNSGRKK